jgi:RHS repeat-associated protein
VTGSPEAKRTIPESALNHFAYDSFGDLKAHSSPIAATLNLFAGREFSTSPLMGYFRARYYSPDIGRFLSEDALEPFNYMYADNNPCTFTDPLGLQADEEQGVLQRVITAVGREGRRCAGVLTIGAGIALTTFYVPDTAEGKIIKAALAGYQVYLKRRKGCDIGDPFKLPPYR